MSNEAIQELKNEIAMLKADLFQIKKKSDKRTEQLLFLHHKVKGKLDRRWQYVRGERFEEDIEAQGESIKTVAESLSKGVELTGEYVAMIAESLAMLWTYARETDAGVAATINASAEVSSWLLDHICFHDKMIVNTIHIAKGKKWIKELTEDDEGRVTITMNDGETFTGPAKSFEVQVTPN